VAGCCECGDEPSGSGARQTLWRGILLEELILDNLGKTFRTFNGCNRKAHGLMRRSPFF
jgi:hypothetical protein